MQSLVSNIAFGLGASVFASYEQTGEGVHWHNVHLPANADELITMAMCIRMLWVDALIYALLTWYIEAVFPGQWLGFASSGITLGRAGTRREFATHAWENACRAMNYVKKRGRKIPFC